MTELNANNTAEGAERELGTREDGEAMPPDALDPKKNSGHWEEKPYPEERKRRERGNLGPDELPSFGEGA